MVATTETLTLVNLADSDGVVFVLVSFFIYGVNGEEIISLPLVVFGQRLVSIVFSIFPYSKSAKPNMILHLLNTSVPVDEVIRVVVVGVPYVEINLAARVEVNFIKPVVSKVITRVGFFSSRVEGHVSEIPG